MKHIKFVNMALVGGMFLFASCGNNQNPQDTKVVAQDQNNANMDKDRLDNRMEDDADFLVNAAEISMEQIRLGQLAQSNGTSPHVKELGKMMEVAHTKSLNDLKALAGRKMITIPTSNTDDGQNSYESLNEETGKDFDNEYADMMVSRHKDAISAYEDASEDSEDAEIRQWATASLPAMRMHLNHSIDAVKKLDNMYVEKVNN